MLAAGWILPQSDVFGASYYIGTMLFAFVVAGFADYKPGARIASLDHAVGELAYPVFLLQWLAGFLVALAFFPGTWRGWLLTLAATPVLLGLSIGLAKMNRTMIEPLRTRIRDRALRDAPLPSGHHELPLSAPPDRAATARMYN
jgi:peptidoglycan/LPS O-acetylase OafA/YrhL